MNTMTMPTNRGFTLVEMAIVLMIVGLLLGGLLPTISSQIEQQRRNETRKTLEEIKEALIGYAMANGRLPCPAFSSGQESFCTTDTYPCTGSASSVVQSHGRCTNPHNGFLPAVALGVTPTDSQGYALDGWNLPIRYALTNTSIPLLGKSPTTNCTTTPADCLSNAFTRTDGLKTVGITNAADDTRDLLFVCASSTGITANDCGSALNKLTGKAPAIIYSTGRNAATGGIGNDETANPNSNSINNDNVFVSHVPSPATSLNGEFDDIVTWLSPNILYNRMVTAGRLP